MYKLSPSGKLTTLHDFNDLDGSEPLAPLVQGTDGNFYGATQAGGTDNYSIGVIFKITPSGEFTLLYTFPLGNAEGAYPAVSESCQGCRFGGVEDGYFGRKWNPNCRRSYFRAWEFLAESRAVEFSKSSTVATASEWENLAGVGHERFRQVKPKQATKLDRTEPTVGSAM